MKNIFLLALAFLFIACGAQQTRITLEVTRSFQGSSSFEGGLIVYGRHAATGKSFSLSLKDSDERRDVVLEAGTWNFFALGWKGGTGYFEGTPLCGAVTQDPNVNDTVSISVSASACSSSLYQTAIRPLKTKVLGCGAFYKYDGLANSYTKLSSSHGDDFCRQLPLEFSSGLKYYRIFSLERTGDVISRGFKSKCLLFETSELSLPSKQIPVIIDAYQSLVDCQSETQKKKEFNFLAGLQDGSSQSFDHLLQERGTGQRLVLPASVTRRGFSPFMSILPRVLCRDPAGLLKDCLADPVFNSTNSYHTHVPWYWGSNRDALIARDTNLTCGEVQSNVKKFSIENCRSDRGALFGEISRNPFLCQKPGDLLLRDTEVIIHTYRRNDRIYALTKRLINPTPPSEYAYYVTSLNLQGKENQNQAIRVDNPMIATDSPSRIAVTGDGKILVVNGQNLDVFNSDGNFLDSVSITGLMKLEVSEGGMVFAGVSSGGVITFNINSLSGTIPSPQSVGFAHGLRQIGSVLYVLTDNGIEYHLKGFSFDNSGVLNIAAPTLDITMSLSDLIQDFIFDGSNIVTARDSGRIDVYTGGGLVSETFSELASPKSLNVLDPNQYLIQTFNGLKLVSLANGNLSLSTSSDGLCAESLTLGGKSLSFFSKEAPNVFPIFEEALEWHGRRSFANQEYPFTLFRSLGADRDELSSGGKLDRVSNMLSSIGVAGLLSDKTCEQLKAGPAQTRFVQIFEEGQSRTVEVTVAPDSSPIPPFICLAGIPNPSAGACDTQFDLALKWKLGTEELGIFRLKCGRSLGTFETYENRDEDGNGFGGGERRELVLWNAELPSSTRFEMYSLDREGGEDRGAIYKFEKTGLEIYKGRRISFATSTDWSSGWFSEIEKAGTRTFIRGEGIQGGSNFFTDGNTMTTRSMNGYSVSTPAALCMENLNTNVFASSTPTACLFSEAKWRQTSKGSDLSIDFFQNMTNPNGTSLKSFFMLEP